MSTLTNGYVSGGATGIYNSALESAAIMSGSSNPWSNSHTSTDRYSSSGTSTDRFSLLNTSTGITSTGITSTTSTSTTSTSTTSTSTSNLRVNHTANTTISTNDYDINNASNVTFLGTAGKDSIDNWSDHVTIDGGAGNDTISNVFSGSDYVSINGGEGNDSIDNTGGSHVTINAGTGNDYISNYGYSGSSVTINAGAGDDTITDDHFSNITINGGTGNDSINFYWSYGDHVVQYANGDGNDTIDHWSESSDTLYVEGSYTSEIVDSNTVIYVGNGSITFKDYTYEINIVTVPAGTFGSVPEPVASTAPTISTATSTQSTTDSSSISTAISRLSLPTISGENSPTSTTTGSSSTSTISGENSPTSTTTGSSSTSTTRGGSSSTSTVDNNQIVYAGGNQIVSNYAGEKIVFGDMYTGATFDESGNFFVDSATGTLTIQNAMDKLVDIVDADGNAFIKAYTPSTAGVIDGTGIAGFEIIEGSSTGTDVIFAGDGGSSLWGGAGDIADALVGGGGTDVFSGGRFQGSDNLYNVSSADVVNLTDASLSDIVAAVESDGNVLIGFNTGNIISIQSTGTLSAAINLADGSSWRFNHSTKSWQSA